MTPARDPLQGHRRGVTVIVCTCDRPKRLGKFLQSLSRQKLPPVELIVVDASRTDETERLVADARAIHDLTAPLKYFHLSGAMRGLTRQRNFALRHITTDLVAFFDDDVELLPGCLGEMEHVHRAMGAEVAGVGAAVVGQSAGPGLLWRLRRLTGIVPTLSPGRYARSGMSLPWWLSGRRDGIIEGDWLPGGAMMWKTAVARAVRFNERFEGYAQGEDLDFSLRARVWGRLVLAPAARVLHHRDGNGRPDPYRLGYMEIHNRYQIHRQVYATRTRWATAWFFYAWTVDTLFLVRDQFRRERRHAGLRRMKGRLDALHDALAGRS